MRNKIVLSLVLLICITSFTYADNNGIWHYASDLKSGVFGQDEDGTAGGFSFISPVNFNSGLNVVSGNTGIGTTSPQALMHVADIYPAGGKNILVGDDAFLSDIDVANTIGIFGNQDSTKGNLKLGSAGPTLYGINNKLGIGVINPTRTLHINGSVGANSICLGNDCRTTWPSTISCDWSGYDNLLPWEGGTKCSSGIVTEILKNPASKDIWKESGSCTTSHAKGYTCTLTINANGAYSLTCCCGENHGEWRGTETNIRTNLLSHYTTIGAKVEYVASTGKWKLTSTGKENNHNSPAWTTKTCLAGGYK